METIKTLNDVRNFLNRISCINSGGCGISTLAMYRWVEKNMPEHVKKSMFHFFHRDKRSYSNNKSLIKNNTYDSTNLSVPSHIGFQIKGVTEVVDSYRSVFREQYGFVVKTSSEDVLINAINNINNWNYLFNREKSMPVIEAGLDIDLSDVMLICSDEY